MAPLAVLRRVTYRGQEWRQRGQEGDGMVVLVRDEGRCDSGGGHRKMGPSPGDAVAGKMAVKGVCPQCALP